MKAVQYAQSGGLEVPEYDARCTWRPHPLFDAGLEFIRIFPGWDRRVPRQGCTYPNSVERRMHMLHHALVLPSSASPVRSTESLPR